MLSRFPARVSVRTKAAQPILAGEVVRLTPVGMAVSIVHGVEQY